MTVLMSSGVNFSSSFFGLLFHIITVLRRENLDLDLFQFLAEGERHGVNTHRGAIFLLGLIVATAARCPLRPSRGTLRQCLLQKWGEELLTRSGDRLLESWGYIKSGLVSAPLRSITSIILPLSVLLLALPRRRAAATRPTIARMRPSPTTSTQLRSRIASRDGSFCFSSN